MTVAKVYFLAILNKKTPSSLIHPIFKQLRTAFLSGN